MSQCFAVSLDQKVCACFSSTRKKHASVGAVYLWEAVQDEIHGENFSLVMLKLAHYVMKDAGWCAGEQRD